MTGLLSPAHIVVLVIVLLLVFGAKRLPELGRSLGSGIREFKHSLDTEHEDEPVAPMLAAAPAPVSNAAAAQTTNPIAPGPVKIPASRPAA